MPRVCVLCVCQLKPRSFIEVTEEVENASGTTLIPSQTITYHTIQSHDMPRPPCVA
jgi:hypothetical protein